jgi:hypothetical protein
MALNLTVNNFTDGLVTLKSSGGTVTAPMQYSNGDFGTSDIGQTLREVTHYEARGVITSVRQTTVKPPTFTFTVQATGFTNATVGLAIDAIRKTGAFSAAVSTLGANADVYTLDCVFTVEGSNFGGADSTMTATNCYGTATYAEGDPNTVSVSLTCYGTVTFA